MLKNFKSKIIKSEHSFLFPEILPPTNSIKIHQIHSDIIKVINENHDITTNILSKADSLISFVPNTRLAIQTADCIPALFELFANDQVIGIAAIHAGWKGVLNGILKKTIIELFKNNLHLKLELKAALGPSIGKCCFEVKDDVKNLFINEWNDSIIQTVKNGAEIHTIDLRSIARRQIESQISSLNEKINCTIDMNFPCTYCSPFSLASYRRATHEAKNQTQRQWSWIQL